MTSLSGSSVTVKARATSTIWRWPIGRSLTMSAGVDAVAGKDLIELVADQPAGLRAASRSPRSAEWMMRVFSATVRLGQSDSSWNTQRMPSCWRARRPIVALRHAADLDEAPRSGAVLPARMCISVDLPAPLWPTRPTHLADLDGEIDAVQRSDGAEVLFDAAQSDDHCGHGRHAAAPPREAGHARPDLSLHVRFDRGDSFLLGVFVARHTALRDRGKAASKSS